METPTAGTDTLSLSGFIGYYSNLAAVGGVTVDVLGTYLESIDTDVSGHFTTNNLARTSWTLMPRKRHDENVAISSLDAVYVKQSANGTRPLGDAQKLACDVNGDAAVDAEDASLILQRASGRRQSFPVVDDCGSDWAFQPVPMTTENQQFTEPAAAADSCRPGAITYDPLTRSADNQSFLAILFGDCTGNWEPAGGTASLAPNGIDDRMDNVRLRLGRIRRGRDGDLWLPIRINVDIPVYALSLELRYAPADLEVAEVRPIPADDDAQADAYQPEPGLVRVALASSGPMRKQGGAALALRLHVVAPLPEPARAELSWVSVNEHPAMSPDGGIVDLRRAAAR